MPELRNRNRRHPYDGSETEAEFCDRNGIHEGAVVADVAAESLGGERGGGDGIGPYPVI